MSRTPEEICEEHGTSTLTYALNSVDWDIQDLQEQLGTIEREIDQLLDQRREITTALQEVR